MFFTSAVPALGQPADFKPHYVSQRGTEAYLREGPSYQHKVLWVYRHRGYPFLVTASFDVWRRVTAADGTSGWMSATMLSDQRTVLVTGKDRVQIRQEADGGKLVGLAEPGAIAMLKTCNRDFCRIKGDDIDGWVPRARIWGVGEDETFQ
ncbi:MAG TPA: SH3 domain-containing protein [Rhizomicrobium sp.]|nr:SH3 domain-containing protein [Rhizomicrobium sp.]